MYINQPADVGKKRQMEQDEFDREDRAMSPSVSEYFKKGVMPGDDTIGSLYWEVFHYQHRIHIKDMEFRAPASGCERWIL